MKSILIVKTGKTIVSIPAARGDFEHWIISAMDMSADAFTVCNVFLGESLPKLEGLAGIIITGSAAMVTERLDWSESTSLYLKQAVQAQIPTLGICYGHQLLAHALGGTVDFHPRGREIGTTTISLQSAGLDDPLLHNLDTEFTVHVSHSQSVVKLPEFAAVLAINEFEPHHCLRYGKKAWGVQFHPEFDGPIMSAYIKHRSSDLEEEGFNVESLLSNVAKTPVAESVLRNFSHIILLEQGIVSTD